MRGEPGTPDGWEGMKKVFRGDEILKSVNADWRTSEKIERSPRYSLTSYARLRLAAPFQCISFLDRRI